MTPFILRIQTYRSDQQGFFHILHAEYRWRKTQQLFLKEQNVCQMCGITRELQVHHVYPWHLFATLRFDMNNLVTLCQPCHFRFAHWQNWHRFNPEILTLCEHAQRNNPSIDWAVHNTFTRDLQKLHTLVPVRIMA